MVHKVHFMVGVLYHNENIVENGHVCVFVNEIQIYLSYGIINSYVPIILIGGDP